MRATGEERTNTSSSTKFLSCSSSCCLSDTAEEGATGDPLNEPESAPHPPTELLLTSSSFSFSPLPSSTVGSKPELFDCCCCCCCCTTGGGGARCDINAAREMMGALLRTAACFCAVPAPIPDFDTKVVAALGRRLAEDSAMLINPLLMGAPVAAILCLWVIPCVTNRSLAPCSVRRAFLCEAVRQL